MYRLNEQQQAIVDRATKISQSVVAEHAAEVDEQACFPQESMQALADAGFYGVMIPTDLGGMGEGLRTLAAVVEQVAIGCPSTAMVYMMHCAGRQLLRCRSGKVQRRSSRVRQRRPPEHTCLFGKGKPQPVLGSRF